MSGKPDKGDEDVGGVVRAAAQNVLADPAAASTKRVAWVYGCIRAGADEEAQLLAILRQKLGLQTDLPPAQAPSLSPSNGPAPSTKPRRAKAANKPDPHDDPF